MTIPSALRAKLRRRLLQRCLPFLPWPLLFCAPAHRDHTSLDAPFFVQSAWVIGTRAHDAPSLWDELRRGDPLELRAVAATDGSRIAVCVYRNGFELGELPPPGSKTVYRLLRRNTEIEASITEISGFKDHPCIRVSIRLRRRTL